MSIEKNQLHINKAINYIVENITQPPDLNKVASIAGFSKFHFHRIFKEFTGETLAIFTRRIRLEHAAYLLVFYKHRTITDIALSSGFMSSQSFTTAFKKHYCVTPKTYQLNKGCQGILVPDPTTVAKYEVSIQFLDSFKITYERDFGLHTNKVLDTKRQQLLLKYPNKTIVGISWDNPEVTPVNNYRFDYGYQVDQKFKSNEVLIQTIEPKTYACVTLPLKGIDSQHVWNYLYVNWLPRHGYTPDTLFCFEKIHPHKKTLIEDQKIIQFYLPIKKL